MTTATSLLGTAGIPLIVALVQASKRAGLPTAWTPLLALTLGIGTALLTALAAGPASAIDWAATITLGISWGLAASGLYAGTRHLAAVARPGRAYPAKPSGH